MYTVLVTISGLGCHIGHRDSCNLGCIKHQATSSKETTYQVTLLMLLPHMESCFTSVCFYNAVVFSHMEHPGIPSAVFNQLHIRLGLETSGPITHHVPVHTHTQGLLSQLLSRVSMLALHAPSWALTFSCLTLVPSPTCLTLVPPPTCLTTRLCVTSSVLC